MATEERFYATGRRKESTARVWIKPGDGQFTVNKRTLDNYFPRESLKMMLQEPLLTVEEKGKIDIMCTVAGGGLSGQAGAIRHGLSRALTELNGEYPPPQKGRFPDTRCS